MPDDSGPRDPTAYPGPNCAASGKFQSFLAKRAQNNWSENVEESLRFSRVRPN